MFGEHCVPTVDRYLKQLAGTVEHLIEDGRIEPAQSIIGTLEGEHLFCLVSQLSERAAIIAMQFKLGLSSE
jgi:hypothetical protein